MPSRSTGRGARRHRTPRTRAEPGPSNDKPSQRREKEPEPDGRKLRRVLRNNGLSIALLGCFAAFLVGQSISGHRYYNQEQREHGGQELGYVDYLGSSHFFSATVENWESEFLQMFAYVVMTVFLFQKGSSESKDPEKDEEEVDRDPREAKITPETPAPVRRGGLALKLYEVSLSLAFVVLFLLSFGAHLWASFRVANQEQLEHGAAAIPFGEYLHHSRFWFESFQNWQSEFLAIASMVVLSIFLRQRGSPESKPVDAPHSKTGTD